MARPGKKTLKQALSEGLSQLEGMDYAAELRASGATPVHAFAVAFDGKEVRVAAVAERKAPRGKKASGAPRARGKEAAEGRTTPGERPRAKGKRAVAAAEARPAKRRGR